MSAFDIFQHFQISKAREEAQRASQKADGQKNRYDELEGHIERLSLTCQAMWEILRDQLGTTDEQLKSKMVEIDSRDGTVDGRIGHEVIDCPACGHRTSTRRSRCVFCGQPVAAAHAFRL